MAYKTIYPCTNEVLHEYDNITDQAVEAILQEGHLLYKKWRKDDFLKTEKLS